MARGEGIKKLSDLFAKYRTTLHAPQATVINVAIEVITDVVGVTLTNAQVSYTPHNKLLVLRAPGLVRSEVLLVKSDILNHLKGRLGEKAAPVDIL